MGRALWSAHPALIHCRRKFPSLTSGTHHDRGGRMSAHVPSSRCGNWRAAAGGHVRLSTPPTTRVAAAPEKARPRRLTAATTAGIKWPGPLPIKEEPRAARAPGSDKTDPRMVRLRTSGLEACSKSTGATGALDLRSLLISGSRAGTVENPRNMQMRKDGSTKVVPRMALLIRGSKPDPRRVRTGALDRQSQGRRGRAHSSLSSSPPARGRPTCRVREPARAASRGDPTEGELPRPRSLANRTEPHLANPRKRFNGRVPGPRAYPYRTGHGRPLEPPANSSTRNLQSATRSMGVVETSPSVLRRGGEGTFKTRRRARPDRLEWAQARGLVARLHLLGWTERERHQLRVRHRSRLKHRRCRLRHVPRRR
jgi:hypothetical protein